MSTDYDCLIMIDKKPVLNSDVFASLRICVDFVIVTMSHNQSSPQICFFLKNVQFFFILADNGLSKSLQ